MPAEPANDHLHDTRFLNIPSRRARTSRRSHGISRNGYFSFRRSTISRSNRYRSPLSYRSTPDPNHLQRLKDISFQIKRGEFIVVVGEIGAGKSSLLAALVGEMRRIEGVIKLGGTVAFCPQTAWIQNATVRNNILFGKEFDREKYNRVIRDCALEADFEMLPNGDATEIGERGITVSGGQKARINIARAAYNDADIVLLDDPLSAVDAHVGRQLLEDCICGLMAGKTRILATHQLHVLPRADRIFCMHQGKDRRTRDV